MFTVNFGLDRILNWKDLPLLKIFTAFTSLWRYLPGMNEAGFCDCDPPCIPVVPKPVRLYLLLWQLVAIRQVFFPHELKHIFSECQHVEMGFALPFPGVSLDCLEPRQFWELLQANYRTLKKYTRRRVCVCSGFYNCGLFWTSTETRFLHLYSLHFEAHSYKK